MQHMKMPKVSPVVVILPNYQNLEITHQKAWWAWVKRQLKNADAALRTAYQEWSACCRKAALTAKFEAAGRHLSETARKAAEWLAQKWAEYHQHRPTTFTAIRLGVWG